MTYHWSRWCQLGSELLYDLINPSDGALMISMYNLINTNGFLWYREISRFIWWRHQMKTSSAWLDISAGNSPVTGEFPSQRPVTQSFDILFDLRLNKRLNKQWWGWWFEIPSRPIWRHCNALVWLDRKMEFLSFTRKKFNYHYNDVIMSAIASQITSLTIVCSTVFSVVCEWKQQSSTSLAFVKGIHQWPLNYPHQGPVKQKMFLYDDVIMMQFHL